MGSPLERFWMEVCKRHSFDFRHLCDSSTSAWPCNSALACCSLEATGNTLSTKRGAGFSAWPGGICALKCVDS